MSGGLVGVPCRALAALLAIWTALWLATGDDLAPVRAGVYLAPFLLAAATALAVAGLLIRDWSVATVAALTAVLLAAASPPSLTRAAPAEAHSGITLVTLSNRTANEDMPATARALLGHPADILVLQEVADPALLTVLLTGLYQRGETPGACSSGTYLVLSRFPLGPATRLTDNVAVLCPIGLPGGPAALYNVHLPRALTDDGRQRTAMAALTAHAARQGAPAILAGDFNATPMTGTMARATRDLENAFDSAGSGPGFTFPTPARRMGALGPFLRIDHVLLPPALRPLSARAARWHPPGADHFPVEVTFTDTRVPEAEG